MKIIKYFLCTIISYHSIFCLDTAIESRKKKIAQHKSALDSLAPAINPLSVEIKESKKISASTSATTQAATSYSEINKEPLTHKQKVDKLNADKQLKKELTRFAQNLSDTPMTQASLQHFQTLDTQEQIDQIKNFISARNREQLADIVKAKTDYRNQLADFQNKTQAETFTEIKKLEKNIQANNHEIMIAQDKLAKTNQNTVDYQQLEEKIQHLQNQNTMSTQSITQRLTLLEQQLNTLDAQIHNTYNAIIKNYQNKDITLHNTAAPIFAIQNKQMMYKTKTKVEKPKVIKNIENEPEIAPFKPGVSLDVTAKDSMLAIKIKAVQAALKAEKNRKKPNQAKIQYFKDHLAYLQKAAKLQSAH